MNSGVGRVVIPEGVTSIGEMAFAYCGGLTKLTIPESVTSIGKRVGFRARASMKIYAKAGGYVQNYAFENGIAFVDVDTQKTLHEGRYGYIINGSNALLSAYTGNDSGISLPKSAYYNARYYNIFYVMEGTFEDCDSLSSVSIHSGITYIGSRAFADCDTLRSVTVEGDPSLGTEVFAGCPEDLVIYGYRNSRVKTYAEENGHTFVALDAQPYEYTVMNNEATITKHYVDTAEVTFPSVIDGYPVTAIGGNVFDKADSVTSVTIPEGVKRIENNAFKGCSYLTDAVLPASLVSIGESAFESCLALARVTMPENLETIGRRAFYSCCWLTEIDLPDSIRTIGAQAFNSCTQLASITIPETVESIGASALWGCPLTLVVTSEAGGKVETYALENALAFRAAGEEEIRFDYEFGIRVEADKATIILWESDKLSEKPRETMEIPEEIHGYPVTAIADDVFRAKKFAHLILPDSLASIGARAFTNCTNLTDVTFGSGLVRIGDYAFENCHLLDVAAWGGAGDVGDYAFRNCYALTTMTLAEGAKVIGKSAFDSCEALAEITLPEGLESIGESAFCECISLEFVSMPDSVTSAGSWAFKGCIMLRDAELSEGLTAISNGLFMGDESLMLVNIPANTTSIGQEAFSGCTQIYRMMLPQGLKSIGMYAFEDCGMMQVLSLPSSLETVGDYAFKNCTSLPGISITPAWKSIEEGTFKGCANLQYVNFHDDIWNIGDQAFYMTGLTQVTLPKGLWHLCRAAFANCPALKSVYFDGDIRTVGRGAFQNCAALEKVTMAEGPTFLGEYMFSGCESLKDVQFSGTIKEIGQYAFYNCTALEEAAMVEGLETIGVRAFMGCSALRLLSMPDSLTTLGDGAFENCTMLGIVEIPDSVTALFPHVFSGCTSLQEAYIGENLTEYGFDANGSHAFSTCASVKIYTEYGTRAVEFAKEQGIRYFYLTPVGFNLPRGELFWSDPFAHSGVIRCSDPITKLVITLYDAKNSEIKRQVVVDHSGQTDYYYAPLMRTRMPFETLEEGTYRFMVEAYVDTDRGEQYETLGASVFTVIPLPFRYGSPDGFRPPALLYVTGSTYTPVGTIETNHVINSIQVRIRNNAQPEPVVGPLLTPGAKTVSAAALHAGIDLSTFDTGRYDYGIYAMCEGEAQEQVLYEQTFVVANYDGEMSEEEAEAIVQFCNRHDAYETFSGFKDYRDVLDDIDGLDAFLMGLSNRNDIAMDEILAHATQSEKGYVVNLYKVQILDLLDRMDESTQLISPSMDISLEKQMASLFADGKQYTHDELLGIILQTKYNHLTALKDHYGDSLNPFELKKIVDQEYADAFEYLDCMDDEIEKLKKGTKIVSYSADFIKILCKAAGDYQNMMAILDSLMEVYEGTAPKQFRLAMEEVRAEYKSRAKIILTETVDLIISKVANMAMDTITDTVFELVGASSSLAYKVTDFAIDLALYMSGVKETSDTHFKFLTKMNLAIESNEAFKAMLDQVRSGDASMETLRKAKVTFDAAQMAYDGLYELMITGYSDHAKVAEWRRVRNQINKLSIL